MEYDKTYSQQAVGINKIPEFQVRPNDFFQHFFIPLSAQLTFGEYSDPPVKAAVSLATWRGDAGLVAGPARRRCFGSDFQGTVNVDQYAYGTGDLKAAIEQDMSLTTPIGQHIVNSITYNEANYNGPALVPFQYLDQQPTENTKNAQDLIRFFNDDVYAFSVGYSTNFDGVAQPVSYQITARPSPRSVVLLSGSFIPGPGSRLRNDEPAALDAVRPRRIAAVRDGHQLAVERAGEFFSNKIIYYTRTIGNCYQVQVLYSESPQSINVGLNLLAFPNQTAMFAIAQPGRSSRRRSTSRSRGALAIPAMAPSGAFEVMLGLVAGRMAARAAVSGFETLVRSCVAAVTAAVRFAAVDRSGHGAVADVVRALERSSCIAHATRAGVSTDCSRSRC